MTENAMPTKTVSFGYEPDVLELEIRPLAVGRATAWRKKFNDKLGPQLEVLRSLPNIEFSNPEDLLQMLPVLQSLLIDAPEEIFELVCMWSPAFENQREWLLNNAYDEQMLDAFFSMLEFADPFGLRRLAARMSGLGLRTTSLNSPSASGDSASTPQKPLSVQTTPSGSSEPTSDG